MITIKQLNTSELIEHACALLHDVYILHQNWVFAKDNPSHIRIEERNNKKILVDRFTNRSIWFGAFDDDRLVGCVRLCGVDDENYFEVEKYPSSSPIHAVTASLDKTQCFEISKLATNEAYVGRGIVKRLFLACFRHCNENNCSVLAFTHNGYLKSLFRKIEFPLKMEQAFKYEPQDPSPVNFYFAAYAKSEVSEVFKKLEYLESDISNNARTLFKALQTVEPILPTPFYWMNSEGVVLGINELCLKAIGTTREIIGRKPYEFYKKEIAEHILRHNAEVIRRGEILSQEEWIEDVTTKEKKCFSSVKAPLYDDEGAVIGIVGSSIEITGQKDAESLRFKNEQLEFENKANKLVLEEQDKFEKSVSQMIHDINTPLAILNILLGHCQEIPEDLRLLVRNSISNIDGITRNLLDRYTKNPKINTGRLAEEEARTPMLISNAILNIVHEKQYQYQHRKISFKYQFQAGAYFSFISVQPVAFKRMMSNLINNAVDAIEHAMGEVGISLELTEKKIRINIRDNGKGMTNEVIDKIKNQISVTHGKANGHGIGLTQVADTLENNDGQLNIDSEIGIGTCMTLTFPAIEPPSWIADSIALNSTDIVVVLDDDPDIHAALDMYLAKTLVEHKKITVQHFTQANDVIEFVQNLSETDRKKIIILTDYELLKQELNGIKMTALLQPIRALLITSHHESSSVQRQAEEHQLKIIPKHLVHEVPIYVRH